MPENTSCSHILVLPKVENSTLAPNTLKISIPKTSFFCVDHGKNKTKTKTANIKIPTRFLNRTFCFHLEGDDLGKFNYHSPQHCINKCIFGMGIPKLPAFLRVSLTQNQGMDLRRKFPANWAAKLPPIPSCKSTPKGAKVKMASRNPKSVAVLQKHTPWHPKTAGMVKQKLLT